MKISLKDLAAELSKTDNPKGINLTVVETGITLAALGKKLRSVKPDEAFAVIAAIVERAGLVKQ